MQIFYPIFLVVGPILLAWLKGDQILNYVIARQRQRQQRQRRKSTRALPIRDEVVQSLLEAEERRDRTDDRIRDLAAFQRLSEASSPPQDSTATLDEVEGLLLTRESHFNAYLDIAWLQSETVELLLGEGKLLRELAGIPAHFMEKGARSPAAERLIQNLNRAANRRAEVDQRLDRIGPPKPKAARFAKLK